MVTSCIRCSNNNSNTNNNSSQRHLEDVDPKIYFKRYDLNKASVLDIIPDIGNSAIFEYDIVTNNIFTIGWCTKKSKDVCLKLIILQKTQNHRY